MTDNFIGEIRVFTSGNGTTQVPQGWLPCEGQVLQVRQYQALFALLGNRFGGDGTTTFCLPDYRGRVAVGWNPFAPAAEPYSKIGGKAGDDAIVLTATQVPIHTHTVVATAATTVAASAPANNYIGVAQKSASGVAPFNIYGPVPTVPANWSALNSGAISPTGGGQGHENRQPVLALRVCIATTGLYPPRP